MKKQAMWILTVTVMVALLGSTALAQSQKPLVKMETSKGVIVIELDPKAAPKTTENFLAYVKSGFYDGTLFHRVIKGFMIQGGGLTPDMQRKPTQPPIMNEADNGLKNLKGTIAMARTSDPHSATSQFFINTANNAALDFTSKNQMGWGYCAFGKVTQGMDVVQAIEGVGTTIRAGQRDVPTEPVIIIKATVIGAGTLSTPTPAPTLAPTPTSVPSATASPPVKK